MTKQQLHVLKTVTAPDPVSVMPLRLQFDDADTPIKHGQTPLLTVDVWEHAYYLDYQNARPAYLETFVDKLLNWEFAASNFAI